MLPRQVRVSLDLPGPLTELAPGRAETIFDLGLSDGLAPEGTKDPNMQTPTSLSPAPRRGGTALHARGCLRFKAIPCLMTCQQNFQKLIFVDPTDYRLMYI